MSRKSEVTNVVDETVEAVQEAVEWPESAVNRGGEAAAAALQQAAVVVSDAAEKGQKQVTVSMEKTMKTAEEFMSFNQGNLEAVIKSGQILATGMQDIGKQVAAQAQARFEESMATFRALGAVKSVKEAIDLQATFARASMEKAMADTGRLTDASFKLAEQAIAPLTARVTLAVEKFSKTV
jgi:phasin family protein